MKIFEFFTGKKQPVEILDVAETTQLTETIQKVEIIHREEVSAVRYGVTYSQSFDGEKNFGEIGPIKKYLLDYYRLSLRSWQSYIESDISKTIIDRYCIWVIDKGLRLQSYPNVKVLQTEGIAIEAEMFNDVVESRFMIWAKSKDACMKGMKSFNSIAKDAFKNAKIGGDVLVVIRLVNSVPKVQLIDGAHICSPMGSQFNDGQNKIVDGVEIDEYGRHLRYHIKGKNGETKQIEAWSQSTGLRVAFLVYGSEYRLDNHRGVPVIATSLETLKKIERYKEAAVGSAEERQKIPYFFEHDLNSSGENPFAEQLATMLGEDDKSSIPFDAEGKALAKTVAASTNKQVFNMTPGSKVKSVESQQEMFFDEFYNSNANIVCASIGIPPNVAFSLYNDSFSASRAATKDWEHTITVDRDDFYTQFYAPIYAFWFHSQVLQGKIEAPGYLNAFYQSNFYVTESYLNARFTGPMFPHIDPLKEVKAEREKLGESGKHIPLTTAEAATEALMSGDYNSNVEQFSKELKKSEELDIKAADSISVNTTPPVGVVTD